MPPPPERQPEHPADLAPRAEILDGSTEARQALLDGIIRNVKRKEDLKDTPKQTLQTLFIQNRHEANNTFSGTFNSFGNNNFEKWAGLRDLIPDGYVRVRVTRPDGEVIEGERRPNGSFYTQDGKYVAIWTGDVFSATREATQMSAQEVPQTVPAPVFIEQVRENASSLPEVPISKVVLLSDSLGVGMQLARGFPGSYGHDRVRRNSRGAVVEVGAAKGGQDTKYLLRCMQREISDWQRAGVKRVVILAGVNNINNRNSVASITKDLKAKYRLAHEAGMTVIACTIPDWDPSRIPDRDPRQRTMRAKDPAVVARMRQTTRELNQWILSQRGSGIEGPDVVVDLYAQTADHSQFPRQRDQLHFTAEGSRNMARLITEQANIRRG